MSLGQSTTIWCALLPLVLSREQMATPVMMKPFVLLVRPKRCLAPLVIPAGLLRRLSTGVAGLGSNFRPLGSQAVTEQTFPGSDQCALCRASSSNRIYATAFRRSVLHHNQRASAPMELITIPRTPTAGPKMCVFSMPSAPTFSPKPNSG